MFKLALSAGHGKNTAGKRCSKKLDENQTREWVLNSRICKIIEEILSNYSDCEILRLDDVTGKQDVSLRKRTNAANSFGADFYLSIHHNAGIRGGSGGGIETYVYSNSSAESLIWQGLLYNSLIEKTNLKGNRANGLRRANLHECRESKMPCVLVECGFMDSKTDVPVILTDEFANAVASACVEVIVNRAKLKKKTLESVKENRILCWQKAAVKDGFEFSKYGVDGKWGNECEAVAKEAICKKRNTYKFKNLTKIIQQTLNVTVDGKFGNATKQAVIKYQKSLGLAADGVVGPKTWKKILGVK